MPPRIPFEIGPVTGHGPEPESSGNQNDGQSAGSLTSDPAVEPKILTVSELTRKIRMVLEGKFRMVHVGGELSNVRCAASGHWYFVLKDEQTQVRGVLFRQNASRLRFQPEDGLEVIVRGHLSVYATRGEYQINVAYMEPRGMGALQLAYEQLKTRLYNEGLFDARHKKNMPGIPRCIGLVTSSSGAAIHDMLTVLKRRFSSIPVLIYPSLVQGEQAPQNLIEGVRELNRRRKTHKIDVLIIGRGGGSLEDLWAFNDESLAREINASMIPVISAVGHETDFTIVDFVSDLRAPTPSAAMELAVPNRAELLEKILQPETRLKRAVKSRTELEFERVSVLRRRLSTPFSTIEQHVQRADDLANLLRERMKRVLETRLTLENSLSDRLLLLNPARNMQMHRKNISILQSRLPGLVRNRLNQSLERCRNTSGLLDSLNPISVLHRGFTLAETPEGNLIQSVKQISPGDIMSLHLSDGTVKSQVFEKSDRVPSYSSESGR